MGEQREMFPVYLLAGFLDSGKTTFINNILRDGFAEEDKTLLISCEEGEVEYDKGVLKNVTVLSVDDPDLLSPEFLLFEQKKCGATQIIVELNGMWNIQDLYGVMPESWILYQIVALADARTFEMYSRNMTAQTMDKLRNADMIVIKHCNEELRLALRQRNIRLVNRQADIFLENEDGTSEDYMDGTVSAFDLTAPVIEIKDEEYGFWFVEIMDNPQMYEGKTVKYKAQMLKPPQYGDYFTPGRFAMVCCEDDMSFLAVACIGADVSAIPEASWVEITALCRTEHFDPYGEDDGPVLHVVSVVPCEKPAQEMVQM